MHYYIGCALLCSVHYYRVCIITVCIIIQGVYYYTECALLYKTCIIQNVYYYTECPLLCNYTPYTVPSHLQSHCSQHYDAI
jgi:hypothetical protein